MKSAAHDFPSRARAGLQNPDLAHRALQQMGQAPLYPDAGPFAPTSAEP